MPGATRAYQDSAGSSVLGGANTVRVNGLPAAIRGKPIAGHGDHAHAGPVIVQSSNRVRANGIGMVYQGCSTTCGHITTGSSNVFIGA